MQTKFIERYFFFGLLLATLLFTFLIFRPFWAVLVLGMSFAIVLHPVFLWFKKGKLPNWLASFLTVLLFIIVLCVPLLSIGAMVFNQTQNVYHLVVDGGNVSVFVNSIGNSINNFLPEGVTFDASEKLSGFITFLSENIAKIFSTTISAFFSFILMLLVIFYFLKDGTKWKRAIVVLSPLADKDDEKIMSRLSLAVNSVIKGYLFIAIIQGVLMGVGLWFFGVPNPALWGVLAAITSLLPTIGTAFVSLPAIIFLLVTGNTASAIGLTIWAVLAVGMIDNFLSPAIVGGKINIPSLLILFSVLGGISFMGPIGVLVGPLTVSLLYTLISIYRNEFRQSIV
ncbi:MAG: AI-2E family transporter [bacterium]|nr:AI-2E family transporter [bacterium]